MSYLNNIYQSYKDLFMDKQSLREKEYIKPFTKVYVAFTDNLLQSASGQHTHIGQNGGYGDAKKNIGWESQEDDEENSEYGYKNNYKY